MIGGTGGNGALRVSCPTEHCNSIPMDWVLPTDEIIKKVEAMAAAERKAALLNARPVVNGASSLAKQEQNGIRFRLRNIAAHLIRHS